MSTISTYAVFSNMALKVKNNSYNDRKFNKTRIGSSSRKISNFQSSQYMRMIMNAESKPQVRAVILKLQKEAINALNCSDAQITMVKIKRTIVKANSKMFLLLSSII